MLFTIASRQPKGESQTYREVSLWSFSMATIVNINRDDEPVL